jgi:hypothetical protein
MIVFLDFDGVLHPEFDTDDPERLKQNSALFCRLPLIEAVLREFPQVEIVISSAWRMYFMDIEDALKHLRAHFSFDIAQRVVGVTPQYKYLNPGDAPDGLSRFTRPWECEVWVRWHRQPGTRWMAMDDRADLFRPFCENLMTFHWLEAFKQEHQDLLRQYLVALTQGTPLPSYRDRKLK